MIPKYRAWDIEKKRMCKVIAIQFANEDTLYQLAWDNFDKQSDVASYRIRFCAKEHCVPMASTGLHDKVGKGKEIYDSDVLKRGLDGIEGVVTWFGGQWWVTVDGEYDASLHTWVYMNKSCEIIGNKYENPELLKGESK